MLFCCLDYGPSRFEVSDGNCGDEDTWEWIAFPVWGSDFGRRPLSQCHQVKLT